MNYDKSNINANSSVTNKGQSINMDIQNLIDMCTRKLEKEPNHKKALLLRASTYIKKNELEKAYNDVQNLIYLDQKNSTAYYLMGCINEKKGDLENSVLSFNKAIETDPNNVNALFSRGAVYNMIGNYQMAIDDYYLALEMDSKRQTVYRNMGKVLGLNNEINESEKSIIQDQNTSNINSSKNIDNINIDGDINNYVYNQLKDLAIRNTNITNLDTNKKNSNLNLQNLYPNSNDTSKSKSNNTSNIIMNENYFNKGITNNDNLNYINPPIGEIKFGGSTSNSVFNVNKFGQTPHKINSSANENIIKNNNLKINTVKNKNDNSSALLSPSLYNKSGNIPDQNNIQYNDDKFNFMKIEESPIRLSGKNISSNNMKNKIDNSSHNSVTNNNNISDKYFSPGSNVYSNDDLNLDGDDYNSQFLQEENKNYIGQSTNSQKPSINIKKVEFNENFGVNIETKNKNKMQEITTGEYSNEKSSKEKIKNKNPEKWEMYHSQGYAARKKENYPLAVELYTKALNLHPKYFKALFNRGFAYDKMGEYDKAIYDYTKSIEIEPNNAYAFYNRAISNDKKGDVEKTLIDFSTAIKILPSKIDFYLNRAYAYRKIKDYLNAVKDYSEVIRLEHNNLKGYYNRALCNEKLLRYDQAEADLIMARNLDPNNVNVLHHLANSQEKLDKIELAIDNYIK